ncbi:FAD-linked sulfhydryl oxidase ERV1 [Telopea speciosissima]|uniref:FAD-linked sulfhydryl oxidase ERV1 n=1 Tax=Telopea speciosissima TaxID=54955 RepID=UPI001CC565A8|nr:FAD-linked sulfhydryl oxidase ERV1 [Telopea speciosissima]
MSKDQNQQTQNPLQIIFKASETCAQYIQKHLSHFIPNIHFQSPIQPQRPSPSSQLTLLQTKEGFSKEQSAKPLTKEELGRSTWTLLHTIAAQFPDHPTRQQRRDVKELMDILSRIYPCKECADHFKQVLRASPVQAGSQAEFAQWLCHVHNVVNRSLGKPNFPCQRVDARWGKLDCKDRACDLQGITLDFDKWTNT